tara:strand:- start:1426 stop:1851 length:426 start_codon:yes stop_codon:yes gene_type:complete
MKTPDVKKNSLVGTFVDISYYKKLCKILELRFNVKTENIFTHTIKENEKRYFITYKISLDYEGRKLFRKSIKNTFPIHKKSTCYFTINGLNKLIEEIHELKSGNINHKEYKIEWKEYEGKLIMSKEKRAHIITLDRVFLDA